MNPTHRPRFMTLILIAALTLLACSLSGGGGGEPTSAPPPPPPAATDAPVEPTTPPENTQAPEPTSAPVEPPPDGDGAPIEILTVNGFLDNFESWNVIGLVRNNTERIVDSIEIEIELFDAGGNSLFVDTTFADLFNVAPGEITPFSFIVFEDLPDADTFTATIVGNSTADLERAYPDVINTRMTQDDSGDTHITGEILNSGDRPVVINSLAGATFDSSGAIQTADSYSVSVRYLDPGDVGPFRITITGPNAGTSAIQDFQIYVDAQYDDPVEPFGISISEAYDYTDSFDNLHLVGELTNNGDLVLNINLIAGIYDADGIVLDAADISLALSALAPGETIPYDFDFWGPLNATEDLLDAADSYTIQVDPYWTWDTSTELIDLSTQDDADSFDSFGGEFTGLVVNDSGGPIASVTIIVYLRDRASNQVVAMGYDFIFDEIPDGETAGYVVYMDVPEDFDRSSADVFIIVKGERP